MGGEAGKGDGWRKGTDYKAYHDNPLWDLIGPRARAKKKAEEEAKKKAEEDSKKE
jgi:hypothetical protein